MSPELLLLFIGLQWSSPGFTRNFFVLCTVRAQKVSYKTKHKSKRKKGHLGTLAAFHHLLCGSTINVKCVKYMLPGVHELPEEHALWCHQNQVSWVVFFIQTSCSIKWFHTFFLILSWITEACMRKNSLLENIVIVVHSLLIDEEIISQDKTSSFETVAPITSLCIYCVRLAANNLDNNQPWIKN